jgi:Membrane-associated apoptosis protein
MLGNPDSKPQFFSDKNLEPVIKNIIRKFPALDIKGSNVSTVFTLFHLL